jgi:hypothetical protein
LYENTNGVEWFAQDTWRATRKLTLDIGSRFGWSQPWHSPNREEAGFVPTLFDPSNAVTLLRPVSVGGARKASNPCPGNPYLPATLVGAIAPCIGNPSNGSVYLATDPKYPQGLRYNSGIKVMPRLGFTYDPYGAGKTAFRGGIGVFYGIHEKDNLLYNLQLDPPAQLTPQIWYDNVANLASAQGYTYPGGTSGFNPNRPLERTVNFSLGVQQDIGYGILVDMAYVGSLARHLLESKNLNSIPYGTTYDPKWKDPTTSGALLPNFMRPNLGYANIMYYKYDANSSYHSLQVSATRRFNDVLSGGIAWTWSKAMDYSDLDTNPLSNLVDPKVYNYGEAGFDRTHILKASWVYTLPAGSNLFHRGSALQAVSKPILDGWQLSGIATFMSGAPQGVSLSLTSGNANNWSGSPTDAALPNVIDVAVLPKSQRTFSRYFNTAAFALPAQATAGNARKDVFRGPGINNWDMSMFKNFPIAERFVGQFRIEAYNAFNHTQFSSVNTNAQFNPTTGALANASFGQINAARQPRIMQLALRVNF